MNNDNFNRYIPSLHHGSDLFSPPLTVGLEQEEFPFTSYYSSIHNNSMSNNNQNLYRPYDIENTQSSKISEVANGVGVVHSSAGSLGNRNVLENSSYAFADFNETTASAWPHFPDLSYSHHSYFDNANYWPQLFQHNSNISEPNVHNLRYPSPPSNDPLLFCLSEDDSSGSMYEIDVERSQSTSPEVIQATHIHPTYTSDLFLSQKNYQQPASVSNDSHQKRQLPIRPIPLQASVVHPTQNYPFICPECGHYCCSSGGLKRHLKFCHVVRAKLKNKNNANHAERTEESKSTFRYPYHVDSRPLNLSTDNNIARPKPHQTATDGIQCEPMNLGINNLFTGGPSLSEENNNIIQSQSISAYPTVSETAMPTLVPIVLPIPDVQHPLELPIMSDFVASGRDRKCSECPVILHSEKALVEHLLSHNIRQPYECKTCGSRFSRKFHKTRHMKQRGCDGTPRNQFNCEFCGKHFSRKDNMLEHVKSHMGQKKKRVKLSCPFPKCEKTFSGKPQLQAHLSVHSGLRPYNCSFDDCNKNFPSPVALKRHLHNHNQENPFQCPQCDARFGAKHSLNRHIKIHDGKGSIKSYESQQKPLDDHIKAHLSEESFECEICFRTYKRIWRLKNHYRQKHHGYLYDKSNSIVADSTLPNVEENPLTYPHACDKCPRKFDKKQALQAHYVTHIQETSLKCTKCSRVYIRRDSLSRHLRLKHRLSSKEALEIIKNMNPRIFQDEPVASLTDVSLVDMSARSSSNEIANEPQNESSPLVGEIDAEGNSSILEGHIIELLSLLVDSGVLRSFGWPDYSADTILQSVLVKCGKEPLTQPDISLVQRLRDNTKRLFSFLVDDQIAMENLFSRRPIEQVLQQVIELAKDARGSSANNNVQLPL